VCWLLHHVDRVANWHCMLHAMVRDPNFSSLTPYLSLGVYYVTDARESAVFAAQRLIFRSGGSVSITAKRSYGAISLP
jgi:hypothetical protein